MTSKNNELGGMELPETQPLESPWLKPSEEVQKEVEFRSEYQNEPMTKEEVEDEVLEAVEEAKEDQEEECVTAISPELYAMVTEPVKSAQQIANEQRALVKSLRKNDDKHNRTCGKCMKRKPLDKFRRHERSEVCEDCED